MRRARCGAAPVCTTAGPTTAIVSRPSFFTWRRMCATSCTICALGFSLLTADAMNSNGWLSRGRSSGSTRMPRWPVTKQVAGAHVAHRHGLGRAGPPRRRGCRSPSPDARTRTHSPLTRTNVVEVGGGVEAIGEDAVHVGGLEHGVLRLHGHDAELGDRLQQLVEVRGVAAEDAHHGVRRVVLHAPDLEGEHLELAVEIHDLVHDVRHHQRVDEVPLDLDVFVWLVGHVILRGGLPTG